MVQDTKSNKITDFIKNEINLNKISKFRFTKNEFIENEIKKSTTFPGFIWDVTIYNDELIVNPHHY